MAKIFVDPKENEAYVADGYFNKRGAVLDAELEEPVVVLQHAPAEDELRALARRRRLALLPHALHGFLESRHLRRGGGGLRGQVGVCAARLVATRASDLPRDVVLIVSNAPPPS